MFALTDRPIVPSALALHAHAGGLVTFEGRVRALNEGRVVTLLDYEVYAELALAEGQVILDEAARRFGLLHTQAVHRHGRLEVGEAAVWVACASMHRREAFAGCEYVIRQLKRRLPIWKKEHYEDGAAEWVACHHAA